MADTQAETIVLATPERSRVINEVAQVAWAAQAAADLTAEEIFMVAGILVGAAIGDPAGPRDIDAGIQAAMLLVEAVAANTAPKARNLNEVAGHG